MPRYSVKLKRTSDSFIHEYECDAADLTAATAIADAMAVAGGGGFDAPEVALLGGGVVAWGGITGVLSAQADLQSALDGKEPANANIQAHVAAAHAPSDAQKNSDITKAEIEARLTGEISSHSHAGGGSPSAAWPVGSVYLSVVATNPSVLLGFGTWAAIASGRCLVGQDGGDTDFLLAEQTGGSKTHTLTTNEVPAHNHGITDPGHTHVENSNNATTGALRGWGAADTSTNTSTATGYSTASATTGITVNNAGGGAAHNNLQPYFVVHIWKRTA